MKVEFCCYETGDIVFTKDSSDLKDVLNIISKYGTEINLKFTNDDVMHGFVQSVMYEVNGEDSRESLKIFFVKDFSKLKTNKRISPEHLESVKINGKV